MKCLLPLKEHFYQLNFDQKSNSNKILRNLKIKLIDASFARKLLPLRHVSDFKKTLTDLFNRLSNNRKKQADHTTKVGEENHESQLIIRHDFKRYDDLC